MRAPNPRPEPERRERGSALILALLVAVILAALGLGLLLQTSLGYQAAGTDRHVVKSMYAADAGIMMAVQMIQVGQVVAPTAPFVLEEDPGMPGFFRGRYEVTILPAGSTNPRFFCEIEPATPILGFAAKYRKRFVHVESRAVRTVGMGNLGTARAAVVADVLLWPFDMDNYVVIPFCS